VKIRRLPETELANLAFLSPAAKRLALSQWLKPKGAMPPSYEPVRKTFGEAVRLETSLLKSETRHSTLGQLEELVARECRGNAAKLAQNLPVARSVRRYVDQFGITASSAEVFPLVLIPGFKYSYWTPVLVHYPDRVASVFLDMRRAGFLGPVGRRFCFSLMHERFRAMDERYAELQLEIWRFGKDEKRTIHVTTETGSLFGFEAILEDVRETYIILEDLQREMLFAEVGATGSLGI
jgi:hypothetical protein